MVATKSGTFKFLPMVVLSSVYSLGVQNRTLRIMHQMLHVNTSLSGESSMKTDVQDPVFRLGETFGVWNEARRVALFLEIV